MLPSPAFLTVHDHEFMIGGRVPVHTIQVIKSWRNECTKHRASIGLLNKFKRAQEITGEIVRLLDIGMRVRGWR